MRERILIALCGVLTFAVVSAFSGKIVARDGLGNDGRSYARMVAERYDAGNQDTQTRPLLTLLTRIPYALGLGVIESFQAMNLVYAFTLYLFVQLLLERHGADLYLRAAVVVNLAMSIATSKMFGFYPVLIDLGALALVTAAFYLVATDRRWLGPLACVLAAASREFGALVAVYGAHRALRQGHWLKALSFLPALLTVVGIRWAVATLGEGGDPPVSVAEALRNLRFWLSPAFVAVFAYFTVTVFGGVSALLLLRPAWVARQLRAEPELATYLAAVLAITAMGSRDIWRYLVFALPVAMVLVARLAPLGAAPVIAAMTALTVVTQRPLQRMSDALYFRDWFPLYERYPLDVLVPIWTMRIGATVLLLSATGLMLRGRLRPVP